MKHKKIERDLNAILATLHGFRGALIAKDPGFDSMALAGIQAICDDLETEIYEQGQILIEAAKITLKPRKAKDILADLAKGERLTPELLDEIKRSQAPKNP